MVATGMLTCSFRSAAPKNKGTKVKLGDFLADECEQTAQSLALAKWPADDHPNSHWKGQLGR